MNSVNIKDLVDNFKVSLKNYPQDCNSLVKLCSKSIHYILSDGSEEKFYPRFGYIKSNIKGEYFVIFCDSCNSKCRKVYIKTLTFESKNIIKFLCFRCAGVRYRRRTVSEKKAFQLITNPNSYHFISKSRHSDVFAILEAEFIREEFRNNTQKKYEQRKL
jgi:hypothetical protein